MQDRFVTVSFATDAHFDAVRAWFLESSKIAYPFKDNGVSISSFKLSSHLGPCKPSALSLCAARLDYKWRLAHAGRGSSVIVFYLCCFDDQLQKYFFCEQPQQRFDGHRVYSGLLSLNGMSAPTKQNWQTLQEFSVHPSHSHAVLTGEHQKLETGLTHNGVSANNNWFFYFEGHYVKSVKDFA